MVALAFLEGGIQLVPDLSLIIHIGLILLMIWVLNRTFFKPINKVLEARSKSRGGHSTEADELLSKAREKRAAYDKEMFEARNEGYQLIEKERKKAVDARQEKIAKVKDEVAALMESEQSVIAGETESARKEVSTEAEKLAEKIASNILKTA
jgi:F-type H+-transporting ATPase subunit b